MNHFRPRDGKAEPRRVVLSAALALVASLAGCGPGSNTSVGALGPAAVSPSSVFRSMPSGNTHDPAHVPLGAGTYLIPASAWSVADFTVTFPAGWTVQYGHVYAQHSDQEDEFGFYAVVVDDIYADACRGETGSVKPAGASSADLVAALREQPGTEVTEPVATTLGGHPATRVDLTISKSLDLNACSFGGAGVQVWYSAPADKYLVLLPEAATTVYILDINGKRQILLTQVGNSASAADRAELQAVLDSIHLR